MNTTPNPLNDWFRKIGTTLSNEDYEAGIQAMAAHDAEQRSTGARQALLDAADDLGRAMKAGADEPVYADEAAEWLRARAAGIRERP